MIRRIGIALLAVALAGVMSLNLYCSDNDKGYNDDKGSPLPTDSTVQAVGLELVAGGFVSPVALVPSPDNSGRLFIADQVGVIRIITAEGAVLPEPYLDLRAKMVTLNIGYDERGLLGLAFHPLYAQNGRFFVYYSAPLRVGGPSGWNHTSHIAEFRVLAQNPDRADADSERIILQTDQPQANHNGGQIVFGPDGFLYISLGDGGGSRDVGTGHPPLGNGQDINTLLGSILCLDVDSAVPYGIPPDNPFVGVEGLDEIYAFGFRNPFRISFDMGGRHELFVGDVGQNLWEEIDMVVKGGNYGWNVKEGSHCFDPDNPTQSLQSCPDVDITGRPLIDPIVEYRNAAVGGLGVAVIGGFIYRGAALPGLQGDYVFGDFNAGGQQPGGRLFLAERPVTTGGMWPMRELTVNDSPNGRLTGLLRSFGQDTLGELYILTADGAGPTGNSGKVFKIVP